MKSLNLCDYPWIPVAGEDERKSLIQIFSDTSLRRLSGNPVDKIVVLRLLLCIAQASSKLPDNDAWLKLTDEKLAQNALAYLKKHHGCFELYGEHPFLQFPKLAEAGGRVDPPGALLVNISEGNKVVLSQWNQFHGLSEAEKIVLLLRSACYACGGKKFDKNLALSKGTVKSATGRAGTLLGYAGYLHSYLLGEKILETLRLNLLTDEDILNIGAYPNGLGLPFWEKMPQNENDSEYRKTYFGQLFPIDKFLLLKDDGIIKTEGIYYPGHKEGFRDPAVTVHPNEKDVKVVWARTSEHPWRELPAILSFLKAEHKGGSPYFLSLGLQKLYYAEPQYWGIWTGGMEVSSNSGEQYLSGENDYIESEFFLAGGSLFHDSFPVYEQLMQDVNSYAKFLYFCVSAYYKEMNCDTDTQLTLATKAKSIFWDVLEPRAQGIILLAFSDQNEEKIKKIKEEKKIWFRTLCDIYDEVCPHETPRQLSSWIKTHPRFQKNQNTKRKK